MNYSTGSDVCEADGINGRKNPGVSGLLPHRTHRPNSFVSCSAAQVEQKTSLCAPQQAAHKLLLSIINPPKKITSRGTQPQISLIGDLRLRPRGLRARDVLPARINENVLNLFLCRRTRARQTIHRTQE